MQTTKNDNGYMHKKINGIYFIGVLILIFSFITGIQRLIPHSKAIGGSQTKGRVVDIISFHQAHLTGRSQTPSSGLYRVEANGKAFDIEAIGHHAVGSDLSITISRDGKHAVADIGASGWASSLGMFLLPLVIAGVIVIFYFGKKRNQPVIS